MDTPAFHNLSNSDWSSLQAAIATHPFSTDIVWLDGYLVGLVLQTQRPGWDVWAPKALGELPSNPLVQILTERRMAYLCEALESKAGWTPFLLVEAHQVELQPSENFSEVLMPWSAGLEQAFFDFPIEACEHDPNLMLVLARAYRHLPAPDEHERELVELLNDAYPLHDLQDAVGELTACVEELWHFTRSPS